MTADFYRLGRALAKTAGFKLPLLQRIHTQGIGGSPFQKWTGSARAGLGSVPRALTGAGTKPGRWVHAGLAGTGTAAGLGAVADTAAKTNRVVAEEVAQRIGAPAEYVAERTPEMMLRSLDIRNPANRALLRFYASEALRQAKDTPVVKDYSKNWSKLTQLPNALYGSVRNGVINATGQALADPRIESMQALGRRLASTSLDDLKDSAPYRTVAGIAADAKTRWQQ